MIHTRALIAFATVCLSGCMDDRTPTEPSSVTNRVAQEPAEEFMGAADEDASHENGARPDSGASDPGRSTDAEVLDLSDEPDVGQREAEADTDGSIERPISPPMLVSFSREVRVGSGTDQTAMMTPHDLNGDGALDLLLANGRHDPEANTYLLNNGQASFSPPVVLDEPARSYALKAADFNNDGHLDLVSASTRPNACFLFLDDGALSFLEQRPLNAGDENVRNLIVGDVNADGFDDVLVAQRGGQNWLGLNDGTGEFTRMNFGTGADQSVGLALADFDGDGILDVLVANRTPDVTRLYPGNGDGTFDRARAVEIGDGEEDMRWVDVGDIDGDGLLDIAAIEYNGPDRIYLQRAPMRFSEQPDVVLGGPSTASYTVSLADVDGNGLLDVLTGRKAEWNVLYLQGPVGDFSTQVRFGTGRDVTYSVKAADMDNDGDLDILVGNSRQPNVIYLQD